MSTLLRCLRILLPCNTRHDLAAGIAVSVLAHASTLLALAVVSQAYLAQFDTERGRNCIEITMSASAVSSPTALLQISTTDVPRTAACQHLAAKAAKLSRQFESAPCELASPAPLPETATTTASLPSSDVHRSEQPPQQQESGDKPVDDVAAEKPRVMARTMSRAQPAVNMKAEVGAAWDVAPQPLPANPPPLYPADALAQRREGTVTLRVTVSAGGDVLRAKTHRSSGVRSLDQAALDAVRQWHFEPARLGGRGVVCTVRVPIVFRLE